MSTASYPKWIKEANEGSSLFPKQETNLGGNEGIQKAVKDIISDIEKEGDAAVNRYQTS